MPKQYAARICWNTNDWIAPSGDARKAETRSYASQQGFGHEEWLFDRSKQVDGWRYTHIQPVMKSRDRLLQSGAFDLDLYTIDPTRTRWFVGRIENAEVLSDDTAKAALHHYREKGWLREMSEQLRTLDLDHRAFLQSADPTWFFNIRFRPDMARLLTPRKRVPTDHSAARASHYVLLHAGATKDVPNRDNKRHRVATDHKATQPLARKAVPTTTIQQLHNGIQMEIYKLLLGSLGEDAVAMEKDFVDLCAQTVLSGVRTRHIIEIKTSATARGAIREAIGQLLDYAFFSEFDQDQLKLHIVAPASLTEEDRKYLVTLNNKLSVHIAYHEFKRGQIAFALLA